MVLNNCAVILVIAIYAKVSGGLNFHHETDFALGNSQLQQSSRSQFRNLEDADNKFEIFMKLGNGVTVGCEVEKKPEYDDIVELYLEDEFGRREPEMGEISPVAKFRTSNPLFRDPQAASELLETEVPYGWWPAECIQRIMGLQLENNLCNCPAGPPGLTGRPGAEGLPGPTGPPGNDGRNGTDGEVGPVGASGPTGPPGNKGPKGLPGIQGIRGSVGPAGPVGSPGRDGRNGAPGPQGSPGQDGKPGKSGINGRNGRNGVTGPPGSHGTPGNNGVAGLPGLQGQQGIPAPSGFNGENGLNGLPGTPGTPGDNGVCNIPPSLLDDDDDTIIIDINDNPEISLEPLTEAETQPEEPPLVILPPDSGWLASIPEVPEHPWESQQPASQPTQPLENQNPWMSQAPPKPAKPTQPQLNVPSLSDMSQSPSSQGGAKPAGPWNGGNNGAFGGPQVPQKPNASSMNNNLQDKRPPFMGSNTFQPPNSLWSTPQFQSGLLQSYGQLGPLGQLGNAVGNSYWKSSGTRSSPNHAGQKPKCSGKKKRGQGKKNQGNRQALTPNSSEALVSPVSDELENVPPRARARVDLELEE
ncbi:unnamed protein product [Orchesella dallaii]|uniref:Uncharacterized protein n=1 Tax=Orchesella dallaii TaxID=48710 RepID=A0ABP1QJE9_9HEXA